MKASNNKVIANYDNRIAKKFIQNLVIGQNFNTNFDSYFGLIGPSPKTYLEPFFENKVFNKSTSFISCEYSKENYLLQLSDIEQLSYRKNIFTNLGDIHKSDNTAKYIDLDFCDSLEGNKTKGTNNSLTITKLFNIQQTSYHNVCKVFNFTVSCYLMNRGKNYIEPYINIDLSAYLSKLLKCDIIIKGNSKLKHGMLYHTHVSNMKYEVQIYYYFDKFPMLNVYIKAFY